MITSTALQNAIQEGLDSPIVEDFDKHLLDLKSKRTND